ncbi:MAG: glycosyltransferase [Sphingobacteriaceae bacterium]|nr:MAG: glycosyltransferase [Sphingobacteriaceae bacterium]
MNLLLITPYIPYPLSEGGKISQFAMIDYLRNNQNITLVLLADQIEKLNDINALKSFWPNVDIETISTYEKNPPKRSTSRVIIDQIKSVKNSLNKETISITPKSDFDRSDVINLTYLKSRDFIKQLNTIINKKRYDLAQIDFLDFIDLVNLIPVNTKKIFVHHEIRFARLITGLDSSFDVYQNYIINYVKAAEAKMLSLYDGILVFSDDDKKKLEDLPELKGKVFNSPFPILNADFIEISDTAEVINKITFIGGDTHYPNFDAVQWFTDEIIPLMHSSLQLHVVGIWSKENMDLILEKSNGQVIFSGFVDDLIMYCKNSIMVVPLRLGSGIRTKILYAMAHGTPIISTSIGCEGLGITNLKEMVIADTKQEFADAVISLTQDILLMKNLIVNAQHFAKSRYSQDAAGSVRLELIKSIIAN